MKIKREEFNLVLPKLYKLYTEEPFKCLSCNNILNFEINDAWIYDKDYAFLYIHCCKCQYQNAVWKLIRFREI
jgi:hypothetical protein